MSETNHQTSSTSNQTCHNNSDNAKNKTFVIMKKDEENQNVYNVVQQHCASKNEEKDLIKKLQDKLRNTIRKGEDTRKKKQVIQMRMKLMRQLYRHKTNLDSVNN